MARILSDDKNLQAYVIGLALGDGNLSNPNGRAVRLRITCDKKYPELYDYIIFSIEKLLPHNKVSIINKKNCLDVSCYSNKLEDILGWKSRDGSKFKQGVKIPAWIFEETDYVKACLRGLFQTDGSIYRDRNYTMVNLVSNIKTLADSALEAIRILGYSPNMQVHQDKTTKYTIRISKNVSDFIKDVGIWKR